MGVHFLLELGMSKFNFKVTEQFIRIRRFRKKILSPENHELSLIVNQELVRPNQDIVSIQKRDDFFMIYLKNHSFSIIV